MKTKKLFSFIALALFIMFSFSSVASAEWYAGVIKRVIKNPTNYVVVYENSAGTVQVSKQLNSAAADFKVMMAMLLTAYANDENVDIFNDSGYWTALRIKE